MSKKNQFLFDASTIAAKPKWMQRQLAAFLPVPPPVSSPAAKARVPRTHNNGTMTEAQFWGAVRSGLRRAFRFWKPALAALKAARVASKGPHGRKWLYLCADCQKLFPRKQVQIDHVIPCGSLRNFAEVGPFLERLCAPNMADFAIRCSACHQSKTNAERSEPNALPRAKTKRVRGPQNAADQTPPTKDL